MENNPLSPTNNADISKDDLTIVNHINEFPVSAVYSNKNSNGELIMSAEEIESFMASFPPGFRFCPTDNELITHYLERKIENLPLEPNKIYDMNIYKYDPETIAAQVKPTTAEKVWYVLTPRDRKYPNGHRPSRSAGNGYWKATGSDIDIKDDKNVIIGVRRALVYYYRNSEKGQKTDWIMHEYTRPGTPDISQRGPGDSKLDDWVLCKMYNTKTTDKTMFTQRKRKKVNSELVIDEVKDTRDKKLSSPQLHDPVAEVIDADSTRNDLTNYEYNINQATIFQPQVPVELCPLPQCTYIPAFCNCLSCVPQFDNGSFVPEDGMSMANNAFNHQIAPAPLMIEPISSIMPTTNPIGYDHDSMQHQGFNVSCSSSCTGCGRDDEYLGLGHDPTDEFLVNDYDTNLGIIPTNLGIIPTDLGIIPSEYNTNIFHNGETNKPKEDS